MNGTVPIVEEQCHGEVTAGFRASAEAQQRAEFTARFGHFHLDLRSKIVTWSLGIARIFDQPMPASGKRDFQTHFASYHPDDRDRVMARLAEAARTAPDGSSYHNSGRIIRPNGQIRHVFIQGQIFRDRDGRATAEGILLDVTDSTRLEREARITGEMLRTTLESMDQGLLVLSPERRIKLRNRRVVTLLDLQPGALADDLDRTALERELSERGLNDVSATIAALAEAAAGGAAVIARDCHGPKATLLEIDAARCGDGGVVITVTDVTVRRRSERAVRDSEVRFRLLAENTSDVIVLTDAEGVRRYVSPSVQVLLGYKPQELVNSRAVSIVHPDDLAVMRQLMEELRTAARDRVVAQMRYQRKDGSTLWAEVLINVTRDQITGRTTGFVKHLRDFTERKAMEDKLRISEERLALALASGSDGFWDWNIATGRLDVSEHWLEVLGYASGDLHASILNWQTLVHPADLRDARRALAQHFRGRSESFECEYRVRAKTGEHVWFLARARVVSRDLRGRPLRLVGTHIDITRRKKAEQAISYMAHYDALTALPNRNLFHERLEQECATALRTGTSFAVLACDLDRFKAVNDSLGHAAGDDLLQLVAGRLMQEAREPAFPARFGGDEFAIILPRIEQPGQVDDLSRRLIAALERPLEVKGRLVSVGVSIGIAFGLTDGSTPDELMKNADLALYRAKNSGRNTFRIFDRQKDGVIAERNHLESEMRDAMRRSGFVLHYQPIIDTAWGRITGFEALLRWQHPTRGAVAPSQFIPMAEESGLISALGAWALREACCQAILWPSTIRVSVNISPMQFAQPDVLLAAVTAALVASGLPAHRLELEITEGLLCDHNELARDALRRLRHMGVQVALDDFGTKPGALGKAGHFPVMRVKVDSSLVVDAPASDNGSALLRALVGVARRAGAEVTAKGIETSEQFAIARIEGCTEVQGFLLCRPLPLQNALELIGHDQRMVAA